MTHPTKRAAQEEAPNFDLISQMLESYVAAIKETGKYELWHYIPEVEDQAALLRSQQPESAPPATIEDNSQSWAGMDGATAWHLIDRHADGWGDVAKMMGEWLEANIAARLSAPQAPQFQGVGARKLADLQAQGYGITGYAIRHETTGLRGAIDGHGFVYWWHSAPQAVGWLPIEDAPDNMTECVVVRWVDGDGQEHRDLDYREDGCWMRWHDHAEHVEIIGGHGVSYTPPYEHYMPVPPAPPTQQGGGERLLPERRREGHGQTQRLLSGLHNTARRHDGMANVGVLGSDVTDESAAGGGHVAGTDFHESSILIVSPDLVRTEPPPSICAEINRHRRGYRIDTITHPHFGPYPVEVFAINVACATPLF